MNDEESKAERLRMEGHVARLREQGFDTVQIFCSKYDSKDGTRYWEVGGGNYCGRYGQVALWIENEKQLTCRKDNDE